MEPRFFAGPTLEVSLSCWLASPSSLTYPDIYNTGKHRPYVLVQKHLLLGEEVLDQAALLHHPLGEGPDDAEHARQQALHGVVLEEHVAGPHLGKDAPEAPDVDLVVVLAALG